MRTSPARQTHILVSLFLLLSFTFTGDARAQDSAGGPAAGPRPESRWAAATVGAGWLRVACDICRAERAGGMSAALAGGTVLQPGLLLGVEITGWAQEEPVGEDRPGAASLSAVVLLRPAGFGAGPTVRAALGPIWYRAGDAVALHALAVGAGVGYRVPLGARAILTNHLDITAASFASLRNGETTIANDVGISLVRVGVGLAWH